MMVDEGTATLASGQAGLNKWPSVLSKHNGKSALLSQDQGNRTLGPSHIPHLNTSFLHFRKGFYMCVCIYIYIYIYGDLTDRD